jgi:hypothetical protein
MTTEVSEENKQENNMKKAGLLPGLIFDSEDKGDIFLQNIR